MNNLQNCNDLYDLNPINIKFYNEHKKWYEEFKASSVGNLIDKQQDMIDSYKKAVDNSTIEITDLKRELENLKKLVEVSDNMVGQL